MAFFQATQIYRDELGQVSRQAQHLDFGDDMVGNTTLGLDGRRVFIAAEMQRNLHVQLGVGIHALEVNMLDQLLERMHLHITQQHLAAAAGQFHLKYGRMEGFFFKGMPKCVVIEFDFLGLSRSTINNTGRATGNAETAARTRTLLGALKSDKFHNLLL